MPGKYFSRANQSAERRDRLYTVFTLKLMCVVADNQISDLHSTLKELESELRGQKREISSLKEEVRGNSVTVSTEVKNLKTEKEINWRFEGNKLQFQFNSEIEDSIKQGLWAIENKKFDYAKECLESAWDKIKNRNKLIRIADSSERGWETVRQYDANPLAEDSDDESRLRRADARAVRKKEIQKTRGPYSHMSDHSGFAVPWNIPMVSTSTRGSHFPMAARQVYSFRGFRNPAFGGTAV